MARLPLVQASGTTGEQSEDYVGACKHTVTTVPGDSGSPMLAGDGELAGLRLGILKFPGEEIYSLVAVNGRQVLNWMLVSDMLDKRRGGFLGWEKVDKLKSTACAMLASPTQRSYAGGHTPGLGCRCCAPPAWAAPSTQYPPSR